MASPEAVRDLFRLLGDAYGDRKFPPATEESLAIWFGLFEGIDDGPLLEAAVAHCREESWPPAPADLIRRAARRVTDRAHRPFELDEGERTERDPRIDELLRRTREQLAGRDDEDDDENDQDDAEGES